MAFQTASHTISYKQYTDISNIKQVKNIIQTQGYLIGHLKSNVKLSPQHPQWSHHYERPELLALLEKGLGISTFPFQNHMESPLIL